MQIPTSTLLLEYLKLTKDSSDANKIVGKRRINHYYIFLLSESNNHTIERTKYSKYKEGKRAYLLPPDYIFMKRVRMKVGGQWYTLKEEENLDKWADRTYRAVSVSICTHYTVINEQGQLRLEVDGVPNADGETDSLEIIYQGYQDRLQFPDDVTTGTVYVNKGEATVNGISTAWTSAQAGLFFRPEGGKYFYDIKTVPGSNQLSLVNYFQETTIESSNPSTYVIAEGMRLPEEYEYTPLWGAVKDYYKPTNSVKSNDYKRDYEEELHGLQNKYQKKTMGAVMPGKPVAGRAVNIPRNYPNGNIG